MSLPPNRPADEACPCRSWAELADFSRMAGTIYLLVGGSIYSLYGAGHEPEDRSAMLTGVIGLAICIAFLYRANPGPPASAQSFSSRYRLLSARFAEDLRSRPMLAAAHSAITGAAATVLYRAPGLGARQMFYGHVAGGMGLLPFLLDRALGRTRQFPLEPSVSHLTGIDRYNLDRGYTRAPHLAELEDARRLASYARMNWLLVMTWEAALAIFQWNLGRLIWHGAGNAPTHSQHGLRGPGMQMMVYIFEGAAGALLQSLYLALETPWSRTLRASLAGLRLAAIAGRYNNMTGGPTLLIVLGLEGLALGVRRELWRPELSGRPYGIPAITADDVKRRPHGRAASIAPLPGPAPMSMAGPGPGPASALSGMEPVVVIQIQPLPGSAAPAMPELPRPAWQPKPRDPAEGV